jgi:DNA-directed RNA polymerase subunit alpha
MIPLPNPPKIVEEKKNFICFMIEGLYPGYGVTIGNALRRVLLSSMEGAAVIQAKIKGVQHEFSTLPGVLEDVVEICLNLKKMRFKIYSDEPVLATLKIKGEKEVKGSDFKLPSQLELVNKDIHIATLTDKNANLEMEILVKKGIGYEPVEARKKEKLEIGTIALDGVYTPIRNVNYRVENMRVGERTDFNRLFVEIETDGTITPKEAFLKAIEILIKHFSLLFEKEKKEEKKKTKRDKKAKKEDFSKLPIEQLGLSLRTANALSNAHIKTLSGLLRKKEEDLLALEGLGKKGIEEIKKSLKKLGLELKS